MVWEQATWGMGNTIHKGEISKLDFCLLKVLTVENENTSYYLGKKHLQIMYLMKDFYLEHVQNSQT